MGPLGHLVTDTQTAKTRKSFARRFTKFCRFGFTFARRTPVGWMQEWSLLIWKAFLLTPRSPWPRCGRNRTSRQGR